ncbi:P-type conjugative transfer protein TrbG [Thiocystis violacea]|uniref:P-type conjugative transfer protein TrbG n=1 Tax=Thiocystis violacea TaxID=13725 RepID=UPI0019062D03|nr:P-type conjugative transfer protein TrbG [Thiocystis violacea]MBK1718094.1 P-type conjugative transfer protein TrbG [Thiocystis violacea]
MKPEIVIALVVIMVGQATFSYAAESVEDKYFEGTSDPVLTPQEVAALKIAKRSLVKASPAPTIAEDGSVRMVYGMGTPTIICAPMQVCDIELQAGEMVTSNPNVGDTARWKVEPAISGAGERETIHIIVKPVDVGLTTSLVVPTDRRTYHFTLKSTRDRFMQRVSFSYPEDAMAKWNELNARARRQILPSNEYLGDLKFDYEVSGDASWKPVRVYNDGKKTIIEMPEAIASTEAPILLVLRRDGPFKKSKVMVNYRLQDKRYIVDALFERAILVAGVGMGQEKVTIARK